MLTLTVNAINGSEKDNELCYQIEREYIHALGSLLVTARNSKQQTRMPVQSGIRNDVNAMLRRILRAMDLGDLLITAKVNKRGAPIIVKNGG